jgi:hypothetical protein
MGEDSSSKQCGQVQISAGDAYHTLIFFDPYAPQLQQCDPFRIAESCMIQNHTWKAGQFVNGFWIAAQLNWIFVSMAQTGSNPQLISPLLTQFP